MPKTTPLTSAIACAALLALAGLMGCGAVEKIRGPSVSEGATTDKEARYVSPEDPLARPIQVGWTSARASSLRVHIRSRPTPCELPRL